VRITNSSLRGGSETELRRPGCQRNEHVNTRADQAQSLFGSLVLVSITGFSSRQPTFLEQGVPLPDSCPPAFFFPLRHPFRLRCLVSRHRLNTQCSFGFQLLHPHSEVPSSARLSPRGRGEVYRKTGADKCPLTPYHIPPGYHLRHASGSLSK